MNKVNNENVLSFIGGVLFGIAYMLIFVQPDSLNGMFIGAASAILGAASGIVLMEIAEALLRRVL